MKRLRILLLPFGALVELFLLLICLVLVIFSTRTASKLIDAANRSLPSMRWYLGTD